MVDRTKNTSNWTNRGEESEEWINRLDRNSSSSCRSSSSSSSSYSRSSSSSCRSSSCSSSSSNSWSSSSCSSSCRSSSSSSSCRSSSSSCLSSSSSSCKSSSSCRSSSSSSSSSSVSFDAITFDAVGSGQGANVGSFSYAVVVGNNSHRILVVGVSGEHQTTAGGVAYKATGVAYNGVAMTKIGSDLEYRNTGVSVDTMNLWYLLDPEVGTHNVVVTMNKTPTADCGAVSGALSLYNVEYQGPEATGTGSGTGTSSTATLTTLTNNAWVVSMSAQFDSAISQSTLDTEKYELDDSGGVTSGAGGYALVASAGSKTFTWSMSSSVTWGQIVAAFKPCTQ